jgi:hypothetical protein
MRDAQTSGSRSLDSGLTRETRKVAAQKVWKTGIACMHAPKIVSFVARPVHTEHSQSPPKLERHSLAKNSVFGIGHMLLIVGWSDRRTRGTAQHAQLARTVPRCHPQVPRSD